MRKDLFEVAEYASKQGLNVSMNTNGWLLDESAAQQLKDVGFKSVGISIDSAVADIHDNFRNRSGSFERAVAGLDALANVGLKSTMSSVISRINYQSFMDLLDLARAHKVGQVYLHNFKCSGRGFKNREDLDLSPDEWQAFYLQALSVKNQTKDLKISFDDPVIASLPEYHEKTMVLARSFKSHCNVRVNMLKESIVFEDLKKSMQGNCFYRGRLQIFAEILNFCQEPQVKTRVMYKTNISYKGLQKYLHQLLGFELLKVHHSVERYATTEKGHEFLNKWKALHKLLLL